MSFQDMISNIERIGENIFLSSRNIKKAKVMLASELNTYEILRAKKMLVMESSITEIEKNCN